MTNMRRPERLAVRRGVGLAHGAGADLAAGQVRGVLAAPGRAVPPVRPGRVHLPADARLGDLLIQLADRARPSRSCPAPAAAAWSRSCWASARFSTQNRWSSVPGRGRCRVRPRGASPPGTAPPAASWPAPRTTGRPSARVCPQGTSTWSICPGVQVGAAQLDRADARAVLDGQVQDHLAGQRHRHPFRPGRPGGSFGHWSPPSASSPVQVSAQPHRRHSARIAEPSS